MPWHRGWGDGLPHSSRSLGNHSSSTFPLKPFKTVALLQCCIHPSSLLPVTDVLAPCDWLRAFTLGSQPYMPLTSAIITSAIIGAASVFPLMIYQTPSLSTSCNPLLQGPSSLPQIHATTAIGLTRHSLEPDTTNEGITISDLSLVTYQRPYLTITL